MIDDRLEKEAVLLDEFVKKYRKELSGEQIFGLCLARDNLRKVKSVYKLYKTIIEEARRIRDEITLNKFINRKKEK